MSGNEQKTPFGGPRRDGGDEFEDGGQGTPGDGLRDDVAAHRPAGDAGGTTAPSGEPVRDPYADPATAHAGRAHDKAIARDGDEPAHGDALTRDSDDLARSEARTDRIPPQAVGGYDEDAARGPYPDQDPAHAAPGDIVLFDQDPTQVQARWRDLQASFVDDPGEAVRRADGLVGEVVESLTSSLTSRTEALRGRWKDAGPAETERLRLALRDYRNVLERLLALSGSPGPQQAGEPRHGVLGTR